jgi:very-short-patch-repair endonuclease
VHHGVVARSEARALGFTDHEIERRLRTGRWTALTQEALIVAGSPPTFEQRALAATLASPGAVVSHLAAARLWRMQVPSSDEVVITIPRGGNHRVAIARVCESTDLRRRDIRRIGGIRVTSRERTMCDLGRVLREKTLRTAFNDQFHQRLVTLDGVYGVFYRYARPGRRGISRVREVLEQHGPGFVVPESELEQRMIDLLDAHGLRQPERQVTLAFWDALVGRVDFVYPEERVVIEVDGRRFHGPEVFESDRERDNAASLAGWRVLRFTWQMVTERPEYVVATIREALRQAARAAA